LKKHIAGIIPVSGIISDFQLPWHPCLMPISQNYLAIERALAECAYAGCSTVWIVCNDDTTPLVRYRVGEKTQDPVYNYRHFEYNKNDFKRPIRIYYVPLAIRDLGKRDNLAWSAIYGALTAENVSKSISKWLAPDRFYISWPYGCYEPSVVREHRKKILEGSFLIASENRTFKDGLYLAATLDMEQIEKLMSQVKKTSTGLWRDPETRTKKLPLEERFSYKRFDLQKVFETIQIENYQVQGVEDYHSLDNWGSYRGMLSSATNLKRPKWLTSKEWNEIGLDEEKD
jgi:hypothetical protein